MVKLNVLIGILLLAVASSVSANESDEIATLKAQIQSLEKRVVRLEELETIDQLSNLVDEMIEKRKVEQASWRKISTEMDEIEVQTLLGEPQHIDGGNLATWYYPNNGQITFLKGKVYSWREPKR